MNELIIPLIFQKIKKKKPVYFAGCGYIFNDGNIEIIFTDSNGETLRKEELQI